MQISLEQALQMPDAVIFAERLDSALKAEKKKRLHFYEIVDENQKMEFINGEIVFHSPVKKKHNAATGSIYTLLKTFVGKHHLGFVGVEKIMISLSRNDYEPDICFFGNEKAKDFDQNQMRFPAPDIAIEVLSDSTEKNDRETKFQDYAAHNVQEYWIVDAEKQTVEQFFLQDGHYQLLLKSSSGDIASLVLPDFNIPIRSIFDDVLNLETLSTFASK